LALEQGWWVNLPDYDAADAALVAPRQAGYNALFAVKGLLDSHKITGVNSQADVVLSGASFGSIASGWAAALQPKYAPELKSQLKGAALGSFYTNVTALINAVDGTAYAGLIPQALKGLNRAYPKFAHKLKSVLSLADRGVFDDRGECSSGAALELAYTEFFTGQKRLAKTGNRVFNDRYIQEVLSSNTLGVSRDEVPAIPIFIHHGEQDQIVPIKEAEQTFRNWCQWGAPSLEFAISELTSHITENIFGSPAAFTWVKDRLEGKAPNAGCDETVRFTNMMYPGLLDQGLELASSVMHAVFGSDMGASDLVPQDGYKTFMKRGVDDHSKRSLFSFFASVESYFNTTYTSIWNKWFGGKTPTTSPGATSTAPKPTSTPKPGC
jgi:hypothetical protein